jgi:hypothetical protein
MFLSPKLRKRQKIAEIRSQNPITFDDAYSLLYGSGCGDQNKTVSDAISKAPRKSLTELSNLNRLYRLLEVYRYG